MSAAKWVRAFLIIILAFLVGVGGLVIWLDPFFHYHAPLEDWYYELSDERSQNKGLRVILTTMPSLPGPV